MMVVLGSFFQALILLSTTCTLYHLHSLQSNPKVCTSRCPCFPLSNDSEPAIASSPTLNAILVLMFNMLETQQPEVAPVSLKLWASSKIFSSATTTLVPAAGYRVSALEY